MKLLRHDVYVRPFDTLTKKHGIVLAEIGTSTTAPVEGEVILASENCEMLKVGDVVGFIRGTGLKTEYEGEQVIHLDENHIEYVR